MSLFIIACKCGEFKVYFPWKEGEQNMSYWRKEPLLTEKGHLRTAGWSPEDAFEYNKDCIRRPGAAREWDFYQLFNDRFAFQVLYGHGGGIGEAAVTLLDFETGERFVSGGRKLLPGDGMDLDTTGGEPHVIKYEDGDFFLTIKLVDGLRQLIVRSDLFHAELNAHEDGEAVALAVPFRRKDEFSYGFKKCFPDLAGEIHLNRMDFMLDENTFLFLESCRGVYPRGYNRTHGCGAKEIDGHILSLNIGWDDAAEDGEETENAIFVDGRIQKLGQVRIKRGEDKSLRIFDGDGLLHLEFEPEYDFPGRTAYPTPAAKKSSQSYGRVSGTVETEEHGIIEIRDMYFYLETTVNGW